MKQINNQDNCQNIDKLIEQAEKTKESLENSEQIRIITHYDCDGISSGVIALKGLRKAGKDVEIDFIKELTEKKLEELRPFAEETVLFTDIGAGQIEHLNDLNNDKNVVVSDHHEPSQKSELDEKNHLNPHLVGIDGSTDISGSGTTYLLMDSLLDESKELLPYALVGAVGDTQTEKNQFQGINKLLAEKAKEKDQLEVKKGLTLYGRQGRSLSKALSYTTDPYLPGITNNESGAIQFLSELGIDLKKDGKWRSLSELSFEEEKKIASGLIKRGYEIEKLFGNIYILNNGWEIREFSSVLNACGRLEEYSTALEITVKGNLNKIKTISQKYKSTIGRYLSYVDDNLDNQEVIDKFDSAAIIDGTNKIHENMIGTVTTIALKSDIIPKQTLWGIAEAEENMLKISARSKKSWLENNPGVNELMEELTEQVDGRGGGHSAAAGGKIPQENKGKFINLLKGTFDEIKVNSNGEKISN